MSSTKSKRGKTRQRTSSLNTDEEHNKVITSEESDVRSLDNAAAARTSSRTLSPPAQRQQPPRPTTRRTFPGAVRVRGPDWQEGGSRRTVMIGGSDDVGPRNDEPHFHSLTANAYVPTDEGASDGLISPIHISPIDEHESTSLQKSYYIRQVLFLLSLFLIACGLIFGIFFGVVQRNDDEPSESSSTLAPIMKQNWVQAGEISVSNGASLTISLYGTQVAVIDSINVLGDGLVETKLVSVLVYQQTDDGTWSLLGNVIGGTRIRSLSLLGNRLAVATSDFEVTVYELQGDTWEQVGNAIQLDTEADSVLLSQDGTLLAIGARYQVFLHIFTNDNEWNFITSIPTRTVKNEMAMSSDGRTLLVDLFVHQFSQDHLEVHSTGPLLQTSHAPVSMSQDGQVIAVGEPEHGNGTVTIFRNDENKEWKQEGDAIHGTVSNEQFGSSLALSGDGQQVVILGNPLPTEETRVIVYTLRGTTWMPIVDDLSLALKGAKVAMSQDGGRVAIGGEGSVVFYDIVQ